MKPSKADHRQAGLLPEATRAHPPHLHFKLNPARSLMFFLYAELIVIEQHFMGGGRRCWWPCRSPINDVQIVEPFKSQLALGAGYSGTSTDCLASLHAMRPQHCLYFFPLPQGQGSFRPIFWNLAAGLFDFCGMIRRGPVTAGSDGSSLAALSRRAGCS